MESYISINPRVCNGKPVIAGTRIPVTVLIDELMAVQTIDGLLLRFPELTRQQVLGALQYCHSVIEHTEIEPVAA